MSKKNITIFALLVAVLGIVVDAQQALPGDCYIQEHKMLLKNGFERKIPLQCVLAKCVEGGVEYTKCPPVHKTSSHCLVMEGNNYDPYPKCCTIVTC